MQLYCINSYENATAPQNRDYNKKKKERREIKMISINLPKYHVQWIGNVSILSPINFSSENAFSCKRHLEKMRKHFPSFDLINWTFIVYFTIWNEWCVRMYGVTVSNLDSEIDSLSQNWISTISKHDTLMKPIYSIINKTMLSWLYLD